MESQGVGRCNSIAITASNVGTAPNPAGLIVRLYAQFSSGAAFELLSDQQWSASTNGTTWSPAITLGAYGVGPWGTPDTRPLSARYFRRDFTVDPASKAPWAQSAAFANPMA